MATITRPKLIALLTLLALPGVLAVLFVLPLPPLPEGAPPQAVMLALAAVQSVLLVAGAATLGAYLAPKVGFDAPVITGKQPVSALAEMAPYPLAFGAFAGAVIVALEAFIFRPYIPQKLYILTTKPALADLLPSLLYGGIVEEILIRWGLMSLITWALYRLISRGQGAVRPAFVWVGIAGAALLFGLGHLPAVAVMAGPITTPLLIRTLVLNGIPGLLFGWLFARRGLESAIFAHMGAHLGMFLLRMLIAG